MQYVYVLQSEKDKRFYVGTTAEIDRRLTEHEQGKVISTKHRRPLKLLCFEAYMTKQEALRRESY